jgi:Rne/Rng family ribonuclease
LDILVEEINQSLWVAATEDGDIEGFDVDPIAEEVRWGSIYWAKVARIDKALDAAYVNLDGENIGIIHNADVRIKQKDGTYKKGGDKPIGKILQPGEMIAVQAKSAYLPKHPEDEWGVEEKNPRVSMNITLHGRYLIYAPMESENRISQRIKDKKTRKQLMEMLESISDVKGCILRAAAANTQTDILVRESKILTTIWEQIQEHLAGENSSLIMLGPDAIQRTLSDHANRTIDLIQVTTMDHFQEVEEWCEIYAPDLVTKIEPVELPNPSSDLGLFEYRDIVGKIEGFFQPYVILSKTGNIIVQETSALMSIDVNRGADERSALAVNLEAAEEIARQVRVRNLGGIIIIDFLKMKTPQEKQKLKKALEGFFNQDPCTVQVHGLTKLGLMEITRHRRTPPLLDRFESAMS